jgi:hypothetical protein
MSGFLLTATDGVVEESTNSAILLGASVQRSAFSYQAKVEYWPLIAERWQAVESVGMTPALCEGGQLNHSQRRRRQ